MGKVILAVLATLVLGFCGILLGLASNIPIPELGSVVAVAVMGGFLLYDRHKSYGQQTQKRPSRRRFHVYAVAQAHEAFDTGPMKGERYEKVPHHGDETGLLSGSDPAV